MVFFLSAANCSHRVESDVRLNVSLLSGPHHIANIPCPVEKRSECQKSGREIGCHPCDPLEPVEKKGYAHVLLRDCPGSACHHPLWPYASARSRQPSDSFPLPQSPLAARSADSALPSTA